MILFNNNKLINHNEWFVLIFSTRFNNFDKTFEAEMYVNYEKLSRYVRQNAYLTDNEDNEFILGNGVNSSTGKD